MLAMGPPARMQALIEHVRYPGNIVAAADLAETYDDAAVGTRH